MGRLVQQYPVMNFQNGSIEEFVACWCVAYNTDTEHLYADRINKKQFSADDIIQLYVWKNQGVLSGPKGKSVENNIVAKLDVINQLKKDYNEETFQANFKDMTAVWKIFLKHIISPNQFPIFDQHVYRAYSYLTTGEIKEIETDVKNVRSSLRERAKETIYTEQYVPFARGLLQNDIPLKVVDEALMSFGRFLKSDYTKRLNQHTI